MCLLRALDGGDQRLQQLQGQPGAQVRRKDLQHARPHLQPGRGLTQFHSTSPHSQLASTVTRQNELQYVYCQVHMHIACALLLCTWLKGFPPEGSCTSEPCWRTCSLFRTPSSASGADALGRPSPLCGDPALPLACACTGTPRSRGFCSPYGAMRV